MKFLDKESSIEILFSDNHLLIVNKPAGLLTQPNDTSEQNLEDLAKAWIKKTDQKPGKVFLHCIHRIDKPVSGIVIFARTSKSLSRMSEQVRNQKIDREYLAIVQGLLSPKKGRLEHYLAHSSHKAKVYKEPKENAKLATLQYEVIEDWNNYSLLKIQLETGRYHQIRAQLSYIGHPIVGDEKYGEDTKFAKGVICLHQYQISFEHPVKKEKCTVQAKWDLLQNLQFLSPKIRNEIAKLME